MAAPVYRGGRPFIKPGIRTGNNTGVFNIAGAPVDGTSGTLVGVAGPGSILMRTNGAVYVNTNTKASPTWVSLGVGAANAALTTPTITGGSITDAAIVKNVIVPTEAVALTAADSGSIVSLNAAAGFDITLPTVAAGLYFRFIVDAAFATTNFAVKSAAAANIIYGGAIVNSVFVQADVEDSINFVATAETIGDYVDVYGTATKWHVSGVAFAAGGITFTT